MPALLAVLPGLANLKSYAAWPVWSGSTTEKIRFAPMPKKAAVRLWHRARDFDRQTRRRGCHGGAIGHAGLQVLHALIFDFLDYRTGRLDPSHSAIARKANLCPRTVATALQRLKSLGILNWIRRCAETWQDGRYVLAQETNAYAVLPDSQWHGYVAPLEPPVPSPGTWGDHPSLPSVVAQAEAERRQGGTFKDAIRLLDADPGDMLATALARLGRAVLAHES